MIDNLDGPDNSDEPDDVDVPDDPEEPHDSNVSDYPIVPDCLDGSVRVVWPVHVVGPIRVV